MSRCVEIGSSDDLRPGQRKLAFVDGQSVVVFNIAGALHAIENSCPHNGASLASGALEGSVLTCPAHGLRFDLATGRMPGGAGLCLRKLPVDVRNGTVTLVIESPGTSAS
jgi:3-phenylpropionate/trans-cinnamate dioxygenase ferredoxin subunit